MLLSLSDSPGRARGPSGKGLKRPVARLLGVAFTVGFNKRPVVDPIADVCFGLEEDSPVGAALRSATAGMVMQGINARSCSARLESR